MAISLDNQDSDELSSQMRNTIMIFVSKFILFLCIPLAGFSVYILNLTEQNINTRADNKVLEMERKYMERIITHDVLEKKMKAYKKHHAKETMNFVGIELQKLQGKIVTKKHMVAIKKDLQSQISRSYLKSKSNLDRYKLDFLATKAIERTKLPEIHTIKTAERTELPNVLEINKNAISLFEHMGGNAAMPERNVSAPLR